MKQAFNFEHMGFDVRKPVFLVCEQQRCFLENFIPKLATSNISDLDCIADQAVLGVIWLETLITGFVVSQPRPNKKKITCL